MAETINLGKIMVTLEGAWDSTRAYDKYCEVSYQGSSYVSRKAVPAGTLPTNTEYWQQRAQKGVDGTDGIDGNDGLDAYQPFKGWYDSSSALSTAISSPQVGDYAYVRGATASDPVAVYKCTTAGTWSDSGSTFNPANNQEFASGESLNTVNIVDNLNSSSPTDVLSAKQGKALKTGLDELGLKIDGVFGASVDVEDISQSSQGAIDATDGHYLSTTELSTTNRFFHYDVELANKMQVKMPLVGSSSLASKNVGVCFLDSNGGFISGYIPTSNETKTIDVPSNAATLRYCYPKDSYASSYNASAFSKIVLSTEGRLPVVEKAVDDLNEEFEELKQSVVVDVADKTIMTIDTTSSTASSAKTLTLDDEIPTGTTIYFTIRGVTESTEVTLSLKNAAGSSQTPFPSRSTAGDNTFTIGQRTALVLSKDIKTITVWANEAGAEFEFEFGSTQVTPAQMYDMIVALQDNESTAVGVVYVDCNSSEDDEDGTLTKPYKTIAKAVAQNPTGIILRGGTYTEALDLSKVGGTFHISAANGEKVIFDGSATISGLSAVSGQTNIYSAPFSATLKNYSHNGGRRVIYEETDSGQIDASDRHPRQRGLSYRQPITELNEIAASSEYSSNSLNDNLALLATMTCGFFIQNGTIYIKKVSAQSAVKYVSKVMFTSPKADCDLNMVGISFVYPSAGVTFSCRKVTRQHCSLMATQGNGWMDESAETITWYDESALCGIDGINGHYGNTDVDKRVAAQNCVYMFPWCHDNHDDGLSHHEMGNVTIIGGLFEYNGDNGWAGSNTCQCMCINCVAQGNGTKNGIDTGGVQGVGFEVINNGADGRLGARNMCFNCISKRNLYGFTTYSSGNTAELHNCLAIDNSQYNYWTNAGKITCYDCRTINNIGGHKYSVAGTIEVITSDALT